MNFTIKNRNLNNHKFAISLLILFISFFLAIYSAFVFGLVHDEYRFLSPIASFGNANNTPDTLSSAYLGSGRFLSAFLLEFLQLLPIKTFQSLLNLKVLISFFAFSIFAISLYKYKFFIEKNYQIFLITVISLFFSKGFWIGIYWLPALSMFLSCFLAIIFALNLSSYSNNSTIKNLYFYNLIIFSIYPSSVSILFVIHFLFFINNESATPKTIFYLIKNYFIAFISALITLFAASKIILLLLPNYASIASNFGSISISNIISIKRFFEIAKVSEELIFHPFSINYTHISYDKSSLILFILLILFLFIFSIYLLLSISKKEWIRNPINFIYIIFSALAIIFFLNIHFLPTSNFVAGFRNIVVHEVFLFGYFFIFIKRIYGLFFDSKTTVSLVILSLLFTSFIFIKFPERQLSVMPFNLESQIASNRIYAFYIANRRLPKSIHVITTINSNPGLNGSKNDDLPASYKAKNYLGLPIFKESIINSSYPEYNSQSFAEEPYVLVSFIINSIKFGQDICDVNLQTAPIRFGKCNDQSIKVSYTGMKGQSNLVAENYKNAELIIDFHDIEKELLEKSSFKKIIPASLKNVITN